MCIPCLVQDRLELFFCGCCLGCRNMSKPRSLTVLFIHAPGSVAVPDVGQKMPVAPSHSPRVFCAQVQRYIYSGEIQFNIPVLMIGILLCKVFWVDSSWELLKHLVCWKKTTEPEIPGIKQTPRCWWSCCSLGLCCRLARLCGCLGGCLRVEIQAPQRLMLLPLLHVYTNVVCVIYIMYVMWCDVM